MFLSKKNFSRLTFVFRRIILISSKDFLLSFQSMASRTSNQSGPISLDINPSPETMYHLPFSPNEPGKFDFYR